VRDKGVFNQCLADSQDAIEMGDVFEVRTL
jgi:hypothetical protein